MGFNDAPKKYVPTAEEIAKAIKAEVEETEKAEGMMSPKEKALSENREKRVRKFQEAGITGELSISQEFKKEERSEKLEGYNKKVITGLINGKKVVFEMTEEVPKDSNKEAMRWYSADVDGVNLTSYDAERVWEKYGEGFAGDSSKEEKDIKAAVSEKVEDARTYQILKKMEEHKVAYQKTLEGIGLAA